MHLGVKEGRVPSSSARECSRQRAVGFIISTETRQPEDPGRSAAPCLTSTNAAAANNVPWHRGCPSCKLTSASVEQQLLNLLNSKY